MTKIDCPHWQDTGSSICGGCELGLYGGRPSHGTCHQCEHFTGVAPKPRPVAPTWTDMLWDFEHAMKDWHEAGHQVVDRATYKDRLDTCRACPLWDAKGWGGLGKCTACGCSRVKLWLATSKCPDDPPRW